MGGYTLSTIYKYRYYLLATFYVTTIILVWPGIAMHDSLVQYQQALNAQFSDHHPPLMAYFWRSLDFWQVGSGWMFLLQISMLYGGVAVLLKTVNYMPLKHKKLVSIILLFYPIYPQILIYELVITKDAQFASSFLLCGAILACYTMSNKRIPTVIAMALLLVLIYGTAVKFQAKFIVIIFAFWFGYLLQQSHAVWRKIVVGAVIYTSILGAVFYINNTLVPQINKSYAWQYVKLYDLAAISVELQQDLIPDFNKTTDYNFAKLKTNFSYPAIDSLVFKKSPILQVTKVDANMHELCRVWWQAIYQHPWAYINHRFMNMRYILLARSGFEKEAQDVPLYFHNDFAPNSIAYLAVNVIVGTVFFILMSHLPIIILGVFYMYLAIHYWCKTNAAKVLFAFSGTALLMVIVLLLKSMAGTPRYTFVSVVMIHAATIFAYACYASKNLVAGQKTTMLN